MLTTLLTATVTEPVIAWAGTVSVSWPIEASVTVAGTRAPLGPANVTALFAGVALKFAPLISRLLPIGPEVADRVAILGAGGGGGGVTFFEGGAA